MNKKIKRTEKMMKKKDVRLPSVKGKHYVLQLL